MSEPTDRGLLEQAHAVMAPFLTTLVERPGVQAVCVVSSSARCPNNPTRFDQESDFDVAVVLDVPMAVSEWRPRKADTYRLLAGRLPAWVPNFLFHVPVPWGRLEVNVHQLLYQYEHDPRSAWDGEKCDTYLNKRETILDRDGLFAQLVEQKAQAAQVRLAGEHARLANRLTWDVHGLPLRQARRLGPPSGHHLLNLAIDEVVDCLYARCGQFIPNKKWKLAQLLDRNLVTPVQAEMLYDALRCDPESFPDLERRVEDLEAFCRSLGLSISGPGASACRDRFYAQIQLRERTFADDVRQAISPAIAETAYDLINYHLCGSSGELARALDGHSLLEPWQTMAPDLSAHLKQYTDRGLPHVS